MKYYTSKNIRQKNAHYNLIFGERSNGKTFDILREGVKDYFESGCVNQLALVRRFAEDFEGATSARSSYNSLMHDGKGKNQIALLSKGVYDGVEYYAGKYYLTIWDGEKQKSLRTDKVIAYGFALTSAEHYKSGSFPHIKTILFDEFMTRRFYLPEEFVTFLNLVSTIVRQRDDVKIFMCGNTVNKYCPYFKEMGLYRVKDMKQGDIDVYTYGESGLLVAVEYSDSPSKKKASDVYFAFNNPRLEMIKSGAWELDIYPHCPYKYKPKDVLFTFFICFDDNILQCEVIRSDRIRFLFIHPKTTPLKDTDNDLIFSTEYDPRPNWRRFITKPTYPVEKKIAQLFVENKVFYSDNETGEIVRNYLIWCKKGV